MCVKLCRKADGGRHLVCHDVCAARRWFTGGQGGSGQEVIAPGAGGPNMAAFEDLRKAVEPHARQGTSDDLAPESTAFTGSARTLDGTVSNPAQA